MVGPTEVSVSICQPLPRPSKVCSPLITLPVERLDNHDNSFINIDSKFMNIDDNIEVQFKDVRNKIDDYKAITTKNVDRVVESINQ